MGKPASPQVVLNDLERCIDAVESTLSLMDRLRGEVGVRETDWSARRAVVERELTRPLRSYRAELFPSTRKRPRKPPCRQRPNRRPARTTGLAQLDRAREAAGVGLFAVPPQPLVGLNNRESTVTDSRAA